MGTVGINPYNEILMNKFSYRNKKDLKMLYRHYNNLYQLAQQGDVVALSIYMDLKTAAFGEGNLTKDQKQSLQVNLIDGTPLREIGEQLGISHEAVHSHVKGAINRIQKILVGDQNEKGKGSG